LARSTVKPWSSRIGAATARALREAGALVAVGARRTDHLDGDLRREAHPNAAAYCASKFAVNGFSDALRKEVNTAGVRVSIVEPGYTATELPASITDPAVRAGIEGVMAGQRNLDSDDVAAAILHIVSRPAHVVINQLQVLPLSRN
jgi:NADP-dependent 3-hydroxy acid dehydrogenase YdfG